MDKIFLVHGPNVYTYVDLLRDLDSKTKYSPYLYNEANDPYDLFVGLVHSLVYQYPIQIVDGDLSDEELQRLGLNKADFGSAHFIGEKIQLESFEDLVVRVRNPGQWSVSLYTSGTTGRPKKVAHTFPKITRTVKTGDKYRDDVWAFAYNPTHIAGLQVFFQAFLNGNTMVYAFDGHQNELAKLLDNYKITHISATSTYYRSVLPNLKEQYPSVKRVTFGGEKFDPRVVEVAQKIFPNAEYRNIYASTEAGSLFAASGELFKIHESVRPYVKISSANELMIHRSLLGESDSITADEEWYTTGDVVEAAEDGCFRFVSRTSDFINVGGYKVNPHEVEACLAGLPGIIDLVVKSKENKITGQILVLEVVKEEGVDGMELKKRIKRHASAHLQEWKIPRIIDFVDQINRGRTGKKVRT